MTRNQEIIMLYSLNETMASIGRKFNLSRQRVEQILIKAGVTKRIRDPKKLIKKIQIPAEERRLKHIKEKSIQHGTHILWIGSFNHEHPRLIEERKQLLVTRYLYEQKHGKLGTDKLINNRKLCGHKSCINLDHWVRVTAKEATQYLASLGIRKIPLKKEFY